ncbi:Zinc finger RING-type [Arabidopsis suecica]|uniref:RING-type E3 ubiquitin transferase n=1 Tax=Arabidopsis suecica TaxID=45249 RepID=A0A8T2HCU8_ARASU|nr:Zinc finger RING-type [Arabidopsis suecica]
MAPEATKGFLYISGFDLSLCLFDSEFLKGLRMDTDPYQELRMDIDPYQELRMDNDHMTYEQLLQLCNNMGYENSSVKASNIDRCFRNTKPSEFQSLADKICCICQDRFQRRAWVGKLNCGHNFHINSVKPWILTKKQCPVCQKKADDDEHQTQSYQVETIVLSDDDEEDMNSRDHQQYDPEQLLLFYEIPTGRTHRPFSLTSMRKWWDQGYFDGFPNLKFLRSLNF